MPRDFTGTGNLVRLILRLDRLKLTLWLLGVSTLIVSGPLSVRALISAEAEAQGTTAEEVLVQQATVLRSSNAQIAMNGPPDALGTFGGRFAFEVGAFTFVTIGLMNVLLIARHTRAEEESGRAELVRAAPVGPWSAITAVSIVAVALNLVVVLITTAGFTSNGVDPRRALLFGLGLGLCGLVFAATALVWVQVFEYGRSSTGISIASIGLAYMLRAVGDVQTKPLSHLSPIGWSQAIDPFGDIHVWPVAFLLVAVATSFSVAIFLARRRDVGAGLVPQRRGPAFASRALLSPLGLAWRLQRTALAWWGAGIAFVAASYGALLNEVEALVEDMDSVRDVLEQMGMTSGAIREGFVSLVLSIIALLAGAGILQSALRPSVEERAGRAEPVMAGHVSRHRWLGAHLFLTVGAAPVLMVIAALSLTLTDAAVSGDITDLVNVCIAALARIPALWALTGIAVLLYGLAREYALAIWAIFAAVVFLFFFGEPLQLPDPLLNVSPIRHVGHLPGGNQTFTSVVVLTVIGFGSLVGGMSLFSRRDVA